MGAMGIFVILLQSINSHGRSHRCTREERCCPHSQYVSHFFFKFFSALGFVPPARRSNSMAVPRILKSDYSILLRRHRPLWVISNGLDFIFQFECELGGNRWVIGSNARNPQYSLWAGLHASKIIEEPCGKRTIPGEVRSWSVFLLHFFFPPKKKYQY